MLNRAIDSVLNQTYRNFELIVVDDNEDTAISHTVKSLIEEKNKGEQDIKLVCYEGNRGAQHARNAGLKAAKGEYIAYLDDDDEWLNEKLELQINRFTQCSEDTGLVYCSAFGNNGIQINIRKARHRGDIYNQLIYRNIIGSTSFPLIKKECFDSVGYFDEKLKAKEDYDMWLRISKRYKVDFVDKPLVIYDYHLDMDRMSRRYGSLLEAELYFFEKHKEELLLFPDSYSHRLAVIGEYYYRLRDLENARKYFKMSIDAYRQNRQAHRLLWRSYIFRNGEKYYSLRTTIAKPVKKFLAHFKKPVNASNT